MSVQSLERGLAALKLLSSSGTRGTRLVDVQAHLKVAKSTAHRVLETLRAEGFVEQIRETRRYRLGHEVALLGWNAAQEISDLRETCHPAVVELAEGTGDTAFAFVRSGLETICLDRRSGTYPVKAFTVDVAVRRPMCFGASGIAYMAQMDAAEVDAVLAQLRDHIRPWPARRDDIRRAVDRARQSGYALSEGFTVPDVNGLAKVVRDRAGEVVATIGMAAIASRVQPDRLPRLVERLGEVVDMTEERLALAGRRRDAQSKK